MALNSRVLMLAQMGFELKDWDELRARGEVATRRRADEGTCAVKIARWEAVETFVSGYRGVALAFGALDFSCEEHEEWCGLVTDQVGKDADGGILTRSQQNGLVAKYARYLEGYHAAEDWLRWMEHQVGRRREVLATCLADDMTSLE